MMYLQQLELYAAKAQENGYRAWILPDDEVKPVAEMLCLVHVDDLDRDYVVHLMYANELAEAYGAERTDTDITLLQLTMTLPFPVEENCQADTALLLHLLNTVVPVGQFLLSETEGVIVFRGVLTHTDDAIEPWLVVEAINIARFFVMRFCDFIESVAKGESTYAQTLQTLSERGEHFAKVAR